ncbi:unnamed protein product [Gadus morhua 'NCC']
MGFRGLPTTSIDCFCTGHSSCREDSILTPPPLITEPPSSNLFLNKKCDHDCSGGKIRGEGNSKSASLQSPGAPSRYRSATDQMDEGRGRVSFPWCVAVRLSHPRTGQD